MAGGACLPAETPAVDPTRKAVADPGLTFTDAALVTAPASGTAFSFDLLAYATFASSWW